MTDNPSQQITAAHTEALRPMTDYQNPEIRYRSGGTTELPANRIRWSHTGAWDDVVAYRVRLPERNGA